MSVIVILTVLLGAQGLRLILVFTGEPSPPAAAIPAPDAQPVAIDIAGLQNSDLFGPRSLQPLENMEATGNERETSAASDTSLNLRLDGVIVGSEPKKGFAMIFSNNRNGTYRIGDRLPAGNRVVLDQIYADRVILENSGRMETLWLYDENGSVARTNNTQTQRRTSTSLEPQLLSETSSYNPHAMVRQYSEQFRNSALAADFLTLSEIVKISPDYSNGQVLGYRVSPGEHVKEFVRLGFRTNDIVTRLNGIDLNSIANMPNLVETMATAQQVTVSLMREGAPVSLDVSLADLPKQ